MNYEHIMPTRFVSGYYGWHGRSQGPLLTTANHAGLCGSTSVDWRRAELLIVVTHQPHVSDEISLIAFSSHVECDGPRTLNPRILTVDTE